MKNNYNLLSSLSMAPKINIDFIRAHRSDWKIAAFASACIEVWKIFSLQSQEIGRGRGFKSRWVHLSFILI